MQNRAEKIGQHIAQWRIPKFLDLARFPQNYTFVHLKPYKEIDNPLWLWQWFIRNFSTSKAPIYLIAHGTRENIKLIIWLPQEIVWYAENIYYAHFSTSERDQIDYVFPPHIKFFDTKDHQRWTDADFVKNGLYADPRKDVLSVFDSLPAWSSMSIMYRVVFVTPKNLFDIISAKLSPAPIEVSTLPAPTIKLSLAWWIDWPHSTIDMIEPKLKAVYGKYLISWWVSFGNNAHQVTLSMNQLINIFHFPSKEFTSSILSTAQYRKLPAPVNLPTLETSTEKNDLTLLGTTNYKNTNTTFGIKREDKLRHMYIIGQTGTGKSKLITNLVRSDMISNKWLCVIDPHGDLIDDIMQHVPSYRTNDVVLFDVADRDFPVWFNIFSYDFPEQKPLIASWVVTIFKKLYENSRWPRLEYILRNVILSILEYPNATLLDLVRMLTDKDFREEVLWYVTDAVILKFRRDEFDKFQDKQREEAIAPITNKVWQFTSSTIVRNIFGQWRTKISMRKMMDEWKIILVNLSKWKIWEDSCNMIWSFLVSKIQIDAMWRADIPEEKRRDFYLYIDEFQNFATDSFATILSEARKYKLWLIIANQFVSQLDPKVSDAIFGNVWSIISMRIGKDDADKMSQQFKSVISPNDLLSLPNRECYMRLMISWYVQDAFSMRTLSMFKPEQSEDIKEKMRIQSRQRYAVPRSDIEWILQVRAKKKFSKAEKVMQKAAEEWQKYRQNVSGWTTTQSNTSYQNPSYQNPSSQNTSSQNTSSQNSWSQNPSSTNPSSWSQNISISSSSNPSSTNTNPWSNPHKINQASQSKTHQPITWSSDTTSHSKQSIKNQQANSNTTTINTIDQKPSKKSWFGIEDLQQWVEYDGYVKLKYNYGLFVTVMWVEWLLHKKFIKELDPDISWKKIYNIGDPIKVYLIEKKEIDWQLKIVRSQE